jgi:hypothetical protein
MRRACCDHELMFSLKSAPLFNRYLWPETTAGTFPSWYLFIFLLLASLAFFV